jgi:hypothetical protein
VHSIPSNMAEAIQSQRHDRKALILYGSETGNSQDVAEQLGRIAERLHFITRVYEMDAVEIVCFRRLSHSFIVPIILLYLINFCPVLTLIVTENAAETLACHFCHLNNRSRRVSEECEEVVEEPPEKAIASWMSWSREIHHIWSRR